MAKRKYKIRKLEKEEFATGTAAVAATGSDPNMAVSIDKLRAAQKKPTGVHVFKCESEIG